MFKYILQLTRWREHIPFVVPLTLLGVLFAYRDGAMLDMKVLFVLLANIGAISYAFMINDVEDAQDDARDKDKKLKNPVASKKLPKYVAWTAIRVVAIITIALYALTNRFTLGTGIIILLLSHFYSWKKVRLKAYPVTDIISHSLMLGGLLIVTGYSIYSREILEIWLLVATVSLASGYGQLYNQLRDFKTDKKAGLKNTSILLGERRTRYLMNITILLVVIGALTSLFSGNFPFWLIVPFALGLIWASTRKTENDSRGTKAIDRMGKEQTRLIIIANVVIITWFIEVLFVELKIWKYLL